MFLLYHLRHFSILFLSLFFLSSTAYAGDNAFNTSYRAYQKAYSLGYTKSKYFIYIDFTKPSDMKRLFVYDAEQGIFVFSTYVTHGIGSGTGRFVETLSNIPNSQASSIGVYQTAERYNGKHGESIRLNGLEYGYNNNARARDVVIHTADYIGNGRTGHSWGCPAIPIQDKAQYYSYIQNHTILIIYYPQSSWLNNSKFLH